MTSNQQAFLDSVRAFAASPVADAAPRWSLGGNPDPSLFIRAGELGLTAMRVPEHLGGRGLGFPTLVTACEILAAVDFGFAMALVNTHNVALRLCHSASERLRDRHVPALLSGATSACTALTEPGAGSDFAAIVTRAEQKAGGWQLSGEKTWIVNGRRAGLAIVFAQCGTAGDANGIGAFLVDMSLTGVRRYAVDSAFAQTSIGTGGFVLDDAQLEDDCLLLPPGTAFKSILSEINAARTYVAAMCNAMLAASLAEASSYGAQRHSFGAPLSRHASWQAGLDEATAALSASQALTSDAVRQIESGGDAQLAAAKAKIEAVQACQAHLPVLLHAMGAEGLRPERCFTRHLAAAQIAGLTDGATNILRDRVARLSARAKDQPE